MLKKNLNKDEKEIYDLVKRLKYGRISAFTTRNKNKTELIDWRIYRDIINSVVIETCCGRSCINNKRIYYDIKFVSEYDNYGSKFSNFDMMLIYILNWYNGCIDEYITIISRKKKLIEIEKVE